MTNKFAPATALMMEYLEEGYDAERLSRLNRRELAGLIVCSPIMLDELDELEWDWHYHFMKIKDLAKEALITLVLEDIARND